MFKVYKAIPIYLLAVCCEEQNFNSKCKSYRNHKKLQLKPAITVIKIFKVKLFFFFFPLLSLKKRGSLMGLTIWGCF